MADPHKGGPAFAMRSVRQEIIGKTINNKSADPFMGSAIWLYLF